MDVPAVSSSIIDPIGDQDQVACVGAFQCCRQPEPQHNDTMLAASTAVDVMGLIPDHRCRRRHHFTSRGMSIVKATVAVALLLLLLAGGSASVVVQLRSSSSSSATISSLASVIKTASHHNDSRQPQQDQALLKHATTAIQQLLSNAIQFVQLLGRRGPLEQPPGPEKIASLQKSKVKSIPSVSAESAELAWEKYLENAILLHPLQRNRKNLRSMEHTPRKNIKGDDEEEAASLPVKTKKMNRRVAKEVVDNHQHVVGEENSIQWYPNPYWTMSLLLDSLLGSPLIAFCAILFLIASLAVGSRFAFDSSSSSNNDNNNDGSVAAKRNRIILDEDEAEIVEFYEKEFTKLQTIPFLRGDDDVDDNDMNKPTAGTTGVVLLEEENKMMPRQHQHLLLDSPTRQNPPRHRCASDSSLLRHHHLGTEARRSQGDLYYLMVLQTLIDDVRSGDEHDTILQLSEAEDKEDEREEVDCAESIARMENIPMLTEDDGCHETSNIDIACFGAEPNDDNNDLRSFKSAPQPQSEKVVVSQEQEYDDHRHHHNQGPLSSYSSTSSLASNGYDIEAACGGRRVRIDALTTHHKSEIHEDDGGSPKFWQASRRLSLSAAAESDQKDVSPTNVPTSPRTDVQRYRRRYDLVTTCTNTKETKQLLRRVSFSNEVKVRRIPWTHTAKQQCHELSSENYLYIMLIAAAAIIGIFSLMPANPSLSPIHSMHRVDIFQRADTILTSQWDVEL